jgi:hypothetical protein
VQTEENPIAERLDARDIMRLKLHLVINDCGELLSLRLTPGNVDDRRPVPEMVKGLFGKLFSDRGYVSQPLFETLYDEGVQLVTKLKRGDA